MDRSFVTKEKIKKTQISRYFKVKSTRLFCLLKEIQSCYLNHANKVRSLHLLKLLLWLLLLIWMLIRLKLTKTVTILRLIELPQLVGRVRKHNRTSLGMSGKGPCVNCFRLHQFGKCVAAHGGGIQTESLPGLENGQSHFVD